MTRAGSNAHAYNGNTATKTDSTGTANYSDFENRLTRPSSACSRCSHLFLATRLHATVRATIYSAVPPGSQPTLALSCLCISRYTCHVGPKYQNVLRSVVWVVGPQPRPSGRRCQEPILW